MTLNRSENRIFLLFTLLYFAQGAIASYQVNFFKPHMYAEGISTQNIAILATLALLPFVFKVVFGLISDRVNLFGMGHRIPYMIVGVIFCALAFFLVYFFAPGENYNVFSLLLLTAAFSMALFDTATDAHAVDIIDSRQYVKVQSFMTAGRAAGFTILSLASGFIASNFGYSSIFLAIVVCLLVPLVLLITMPRSTCFQKQKKFEWRAFSLFLNPHTIAFGVVLTCSWFLYQGIDTTVTFYLAKDLSASESTIGAYGTVKGVSMMIGAASILVIYKRFNISLAIVSALVLTTISGLTVYMANSLSFVPLIAILLGVTAGFHWTVWMALVMNLADKRVAGSTIAIFQMMANIGIAAGEGIATTLTSTIGFDNVFLRFALLNLLIIPPTILLMKRMADVK